jgi:hypothetical protein
MMIIIFFLYTFPTYRAENLMSEQYSRTGDEIYAAIP